LPGSQPYTNRRTIWVSTRHDGWRTLDFLLDVYPHAGREAWEERLSGGWLQRNDQAMSPHDRVRRGDCLHHLFANTVEPDVATDIRVMYEDEAIVVVQKPAPLPVHPCGRFNFNTLISILNQVYRPARLRLAHRIDANTTGLVVLSRTARVARRLQPQFERRTVKKGYLVRVLGHPPQDQFDCDECISSQRLAVGARRVAPTGLASLTHFQVEQRLSDGTAILQAFPITGRTNQIRIHAWHLGYPIVGDPTYLPDHRLGPNQTTEPGVAGLCLHAQQIQFVHPTRNERVAFSADLPAWCEGLSLTRFHGVAQEDVQIGMSP
jgi:RluA family pseudouridine synthase